MRRWTSALSERRHVRRKIVDDEAFNMHSDQLRSCRRCHSMAAGLGKAAGRQEIREIQVVSMRDSECEMIASKSRRLPTEGGARRAMNFRLPSFGCGYLQDITHRYLHHTLPNSLKIMATITYELFLPRGMLSKPSSLSKRRNAVQVFQDAMEKVSPRIKHDFDGMNRWIIVIK